MFRLLAQLGEFHGQVARPAWGLEQWAIFIIILLGFIAIVVVAAKAMGFQPKPWMYQMAIVVAVVAAAIIAIKLIAMML